MLFGGADPYRPIVDLIGQRYDAEFLAFTSRQDAPFHVRFDIGVGDVDDGLGWDGTDKFLTGGLRKSDDLVVGAVHADEGTGGFLLTFHEPGRVAFKLGQVADEAGFQAGLIFHTITVRVIIHVGIHGAVFDVDDLALKVTDRDGHGRRDVLLPYSAVIPEHVFGVVSKLPFVPPEFFEDARSDPC